MIHRIRGDDFGVLKTAMARMFDILGFFVCVLCVLCFGFWFENN